MPKRNPTRAKNSSRKFQQTETSKLTAKQIMWLVGGVATVVLVLMLGFNMFVTVGAGEIVIKQGAIDGKLDVWTQPGLYCQCLGKITHYKKSNQIWFSHKNDEGKDSDESIKVRFNDGGHGNISGSLSFDLPIDTVAFTKLHSTFGSQAAIEHRLMRQVVEKAIYMAGPLMSSKESSGESRADLINYIADQISHGVYKTEKFERKVPDVLSGQEKTVTVVRPMANPKNPVEFLREEKSPIEEFGIRVYNLAIKNISYDPQVEEQIKQQQQAIMAIQTQMAKAKEAEQKVLTVEKEGQAKAAEAKWLQEVEKSKAVTAAEQERDVAKLALDTAQLEKAKQIAEGEGEAKRRKLIMESDGALKQKLDAYVEINKAYAAAMANQPQVPAVVMGGGSSGNPADLFQMLAVKTARDLALDFRPGSTEPEAKKKK